MWLPTPWAVTRELWREQRPGDITLSSQLGPLGAPDKPASGRGGEERGRFLPGFQWENKEKRRRLRNLGLGCGSGNKEREQPRLCKCTQINTGAEPYCIRARRFLEANPALQVHKGYLAAPRTLHCKQTPGLLEPRDI